MRILLTTLCVAASAVVTALSVSILPFYDSKNGVGQPLMWITAGLWVVFTLAIIALRKVPARAAIVLVLAGSVAIGGAAMFGPPNTSTDSARYAWDGIVQNAGISPYEYVPADPALSDLRPEWLFPTPVLADSGENGLTCEGSRVMKTKEVGTGEVLCTTINRATVPTIYPPTAELFFAAVRFFTGPAPTYWPMQLVGLLMSLGVTVLLLRTLLKRGLDPRWAALWGWSPLAATEAVTNSHVDMLGALLLLVATLAVASGRRWLGGIALGASIGTKLIPVVGTPALLGRKPWVIIGAAIATFALLYVPYVLGSGFGVLGYLPGYLTEEGYNSGTRFILVSLLVKGPAAAIIVAAIIAVTAVIVWRRSTPDDPWLGQTVMIGVTLLAVTPIYPWYALMLVPMIAMTGRWEWMALPFALTQRLMVTAIIPARITIALAIVLIVVISVRRAGPGALSMGLIWLRHPLSRPSKVLVRTVPIIPGAPLK
ncbi:glycosyltransferase family 87 protein [Glaciihabitans sp. dw_435]|uniref:glycosyltransferase family 87 protein n=1 Tax=Glaciihabitans sp. dw_435 TaxID=2720081 RepID=UPI0027DDEF65|nr:glycosyltransferase family 87 protein [Glaciihabitans sp. dw_435]